MVEGTSHMSSPGPDVIKTVTGRDVSFEDLGGRRRTGSSPASRTTKAKGRAGLHRLRPGPAVHLASNNLDEPRGWRGLS